MTIAERIKNDLLRLLAEGGELPFKLSLSAIAKHFGVSPMPVRTAVQTLVDEGVLEKGAKGRLTVNADALPLLDELPEAAPALGQQTVAGQIEAEIVRRALTQDEHYLRESATAEQYGVGRTVVRRIFSELAGRSLLKHVPRCGWQVRPYREKDMTDYLHLRELLEREALNQAFPRLDPSKLKRMRDDNQHSGIGRPASLNNDMHAYWIDLCDNRYIRSFFEREGRYYGTIFDYAGLAPSIIDKMVDQHHAVLDALLDRDLPKALDALSQHIQVQRANVAKMIERHRQASDRSFAEPPG